MSEDMPTPSEGHEAQEDLMQKVDELERQIGHYNEEGELDTSQITDLVVAVGGSAIMAMLLIRYFRNKKKEKKKSFSFFNRPKKNNQLSKLMKQQAALLLIAIFRKEIVKLLQKLDILDEGEFL